MVNQAAKGQLHSTVPAYMTQQGGLGNAVATSEAVIQLLWQGGLMLLQHQISDAASDCLRGIDASE